MTPDAAPSGVLLIDKPLGMTSFDVIRQLRHTTGQRKLGHAGTLDPMATGLLLILVNQATRLSDHIMHAPKRYDAQLTFGVATDSEDREGQPTSTAPWEHITLAAIEAALPSLTGDVMQRPPAFSALHVQGERAYDLARRGQAPEMEARQVRIEEISDLVFEPPVLRFSVRCGPGTYIRSIARDLGEAVGSVAHLSGLRRTHTARCALSDALPLSALVSDPSLFPACMMSMYTSLAHLPTLTLTTAQAVAMTRGQAVPLLATLTPAIYRVPIPGGDGLLAIVEATPNARPVTRVFQPAWSPEG
jgi:tRNA pseudouridine55 synthase